MNYFQLSPKDQRNNSWILYDHPAVGPVRLKDQYKPLRCPGCHKFDELAAIRIGITEPQIGGQADYLMTSDGLIVASEKLVGLLNQNGIGGFESISLRPYSLYSILWPAALVKTDREAMGIRIHGTCDACGRYLETSFLPRLLSLTPPRDPMSLFSSEVWAEGRHGKRLWFNASEQIVDVLRAACITGVECLLLKP
jgi:hypothetical protein